uniref:BTB domain-containing protein n=1 Tax=Acrobeloides nanus TaxID=290746 RepID=A0A914EH52_9BILA
MLHVCINERFSDVVFLTGKDEVKIPAHKFMLCVGSSVFAQMFTGTVTLSTKQETIQHENKELELVRIPDITPEAMTCVLKYMYTEVAQLEVDYVFNVLYADQVLLYENEHLLKTCEKIISESTSTVIQSDAFKNIDEKTLGHILGYDSLKIEEWSLFQEVLLWAESECTRKELEPTKENKRHVLENILTSIRFPIMLQSEFASYANDEDCILNERECLDLLLTFALGPDKLKSIPFKFDPRSLNEYSVYRFNSNSSYRYDQYNSYDGTTFMGEQSIGFTLQSSCSAKVWLIGFSIFGTNTKTVGMEITYTIKRDDKTLSQENKFIENLYSSSQNNYHRLDFPRPVVIYPGVLYVVSYKSSVDSYSFVNGYNGLSSTKFQHSKSKEQVEIKFSNVNGSKTCVSSGQIPRLYFGS